MAKPKQHVEEPDLSDDDLDLLDEVWDQIAKEDADKKRAAEAAFERSFTLALVRDQPRCSDLIEGAPGKYTNEDGDGCDAPSSSDGREKKALPKMQDDVPASDARSPEAAKAAQRLRSAAERVEPEITALLQKVADEAGGRLVGLEYRLKSTDSLARKIDTDAKAEYDGNREAAAHNVSDAVRYTLEVSGDGYLQSARSVFERLREDGWAVKVKNFWLRGDPYDGINAKLEKGGVKVEFQVHTPESFETKEFKLHSFYEKYRSSKIDRERVLLWEHMVSVATNIPKPKDYDDLLKLGTLVFQNYQTSVEAGVA